MNFRVLFLVLSLIIATPLQATKPSNGDWLMYLQDDSVYQNSPAHRDNVKVRTIRRKGEIYIDLEEIQKLLDAQKQIEVKGEEVQRIQGRDYIQAELLAKKLNQKLIIEEGLLYFYTPEVNKKPVEEFMSYSQVYKDDIEKLQKEEAFNIPILMYHLCIDKIPEGLGGMAVTPKRFEEQMKALLEAGYEPIHFEQYYDFITHDIPLPAKPIMITFDDGYENNYTKAFPILKQMGIKATIFINAYTVDHEMGAYSHLDWEQMREMEAGGLVSIQSHGYIHENINSLTDKKLKESVEKGFNRIESELGARKIYVFSYPGYSYNQKTLEKLREMGIHIQVTALGEKITNKTPLHNLTRQRASQGQSGKGLVKAIQ